MSGVGAPRVSLEVMLLLSSGFIVFRLRAGIFAGFSVAVMTVQQVQVLLPVCCAADCWFFGFWSCCLVLGDVLGLFRVGLGIARGLNFDVIYQISDPQHLPCCLVLYSGACFVVSFSVEANLCLHGGCYAYIRHLCIAFFSVSLRLVRVSVLINFAVSKEKINSCKSNGLLSLQLKIGRLSWLKKWRPSYTKSD